MVILVLVLLYVLCTLVQIEVGRRLSQLFFKHDPKLGFWLGLSATVMALAFAGSQFMLVQFRDSMYGDCPPLYFITPGVHILYVSQLLLHYFAFELNTYWFDCLAFPAILGLLSHAITLFVLDYLVRRLACISTHQVRDAKKATH